MRRTTEAMGALMIALGSLVVYPGCMVPEATGRADFTDASTGAGGSSGAGGASGGTGGQAGMDGGAGGQDSAAGSGGSAGAAGDGGSAGVGGTNDGGGGTTGEDAGDDADASPDAPDSADAGDDDAAEEPSPCIDDTRQCDGSVPQHCVQGVWQAEPCAPGWAYVTAYGCEQGLCSIATCEPGYSNCDNQLSTGCEQSTAADVNNCGGCGSKCSAVAGPDVNAYTCASSECVITACTGGKLDCDEIASTGCETDPQTAPDHCGGCGSACSANHWSHVGTYSCAGASCGIAQCSAGYGDCNTSKDDGCETQTAYDVDNCGSCGNRCSDLGLAHVDAYKCWAGNCGVETCASGFLDCDGASANGCEGSFNGVAVAAGEDHTCALKGDSTVWCWGGNSFGQLGDASTNPTTAPVAVTGLASASLVQAGQYHTCALADGGQVWCWGRNDQGQLGNGLQDDSSVPVQAPSLGDGALQLSTGGNHTCAIKADHSLWCWGANHAGQIGDGTTTSTPKLTPVKVTALGTKAKQVSAGYSYTCAVDTDNSLWCWGANGFGQLGDGTSTPHPAPAKIIELDATIAEVASGYDHTCARRSGGDVRCWGTNANGQLGNGTTTPTTAIVSVSSLGDQVAFLAGGWYFTCAGKTDHTLWCWGHDHVGEVGDGVAPAAPNAVPTPVQALLGSTVTQAGAGNNHACARKSDGSVWCWGALDWGKLGYSSGTPATPGAVTYECP